MKNSFPGSKMIESGNTIVVLNDDGTHSFFWLCASVLNDYVFFSWLGDPRRPTSSDYWRVSQRWFSKRVANGTIEVFNSLPLDRYGDEFEQQARGRRQ